MVRKEDIRRTVRATRSDAAVLVITFLATLVLNIEFAIYVGVLFSIGLHLANTSHPRIYSMVPDLGTGKLVGSAYGQTCCQMDIIHIEGSIFFGSATTVLEDLRRRLRASPPTRRSEGESNSFGCRHPMQIPRRLRRATKTWNTPRPGWRCCQKPNPVCCWLNFPLKQMPIFFKIHLLPDLFSVCRCVSF